ncbi:MAG: CHAD domain-containing protein [Solirubrobacterales bacterium]
MSDSNASGVREEEKRQFREDASIVLEQRVEQIAEISRVLLDVTDTEPAEAMWLGARRLKAALELFRPVLSKTQFPGTRDETRQLIRALGRRRDTDSMIATFEAIGAEMDEGGEYGLARLIESLRVQQAECNRILASLANGRRLQALRVRVEDLSGGQFDVIDGAEGLDYRVPEAVPGSARRLVSQRLERLRKSVPHALESSAVKEQHRMRVSAERLRYALELTAEALGTQAHTARRAARGLQEVLGEMRDCDIALPTARDQVRVFEREDVKTILERSQGSRDLDPVLVQAAPNRMLYRGPHLASVHLEARRQMLFERFRRLWLEQSRQGVWVALGTSLGD